MPITDPNADAKLSEQKQLIEEAIQYHQVGQLDQADAICRNILESYPQNADAIHLMGVSAQIRGSYEKAIELIRQAIAMKPASPIYLNNLGNTYMKGGRYQEAIDAFSEALVHGHKLPAIWLNLGNAHRYQRQFAEAIRCFTKYLHFVPQDLKVQFILGKTYREVGDLAAAEDCLMKILDRQPSSVASLEELVKVLKADDRLDEVIGHFTHALDLEPRNAELWVRLGAVQKELRMFAPAEGSLKRALEIDGESVPALNELGVLLARKDRFKEARSCFEQGLVISPENSAINANLGNLLRHMGQIDAARKCLNHALDLDPGNLDACLNLGTLEKEQGRPELAARLFQRIIQRNPDHRKAYNNLGVVFKDQGFLDEASSVLQAALRLNPHDPDALLNLGNVYKAQGRIQSALDCYGRALEHAPEHAAANSNYLYAQLYHSDMGRRQLYKTACQWGDRQSRALSSPVTFANDPTPTRRLRVGYVSPDFRRHSVSFFFQPLVEHHNKDQFEIFAYAEVPQPDDSTARIRSCCHHWRFTVGQTDKAVAQNIRDDRIDILVDLAGHTAGNRLNVFAKKPAPIQISWLGYPGTTGLPMMDYRLTDEVADPYSEADQFHSEHLLRLPGCFLCYTPPGSLPSVVASSSGNTSIIFGSFNNLPKVNEKVIHCWAQILREVPQANLFLKSKPLADESTRDRYLGLFQKNDVSPERIILKHWAESTTEHLELYNDVTIALDPFPYNGTTTTCEALLMGVPVVTLCGNRHSARVGASLLSRIGLDDLIAADEQTYVQKALNLARDRDHLQLLRQNLRNKLLNSRLCNASDFARKVEHCYRQQWVQWCRIGGKEIPLTATDQ